MRNTIIIYNSYCQTIKILKNDWLKITMFDLGQTNVTLKRRRREYILIIKLV